MVISRTQNLELNVRFVTNTTTTAIIRRMNRRRARDEENSPLASQLCHRPLFKLNFPETSCHTPIRPETVTRPVQPYLFIINTCTRSILPILSNPIFKENIAKQAYQHTLSTILTHNASDT